MHYEYETRWRHGQSNKVWKTVNVAVLLLADEVTATVVGTKGDDIAEQQRL